MDGKNSDHSHANGVFDTYADRYSEKVGSALGTISHDVFIRAKARLLAEEIPLFASNQKICLLDVGCGVGVLHPLLEDKVDRLVGIDVSAASIEMARQYNPGVEYAVFDGTNFPSDTQFDLILLVCVLHHVPLAVRPDLMGNLRQMLTPGGEVAIIEHNPYNPLTRCVVASCELDRDADLLSMKATRELLMGAGFSWCKLRHFQFTPVAAGPLWAAERYLRWLPLGAQYLMRAR